MPRIRLNLTSKMMLFAAVIAVLPLLVAGQSLIRVTRDELKSAANDQIAGAARKLTGEFNDFFEYSLLTPLDLIRNAIGGESLGSQEKIVVLKQGIADLPDVVALQVNVEGLPKPIIVAQEAYVNRLKVFFPTPLDVLRVDAGKFDAAAASTRAAIDIVHVAETGDWLATASLPIDEGIGGRKATLYARINLERLRNVIVNDPFAKTGTIHVVGADGKVIFATTTAAMITPASWRRRWRCCRLTQRRLPSSRSSSPMVPHLSVPSRCRALFRGRSSSRRPRATPIARSPT